MLGTTGDPGRGRSRSGARRGAARRGVRMLAWRGDDQVSPLFVGAWTAASFVVHDEARPPGGVGLPAARSRANDRLPDLLLGRDTAL
jgi:hypothetical protein